LTPTSEELNAELEERRQALKQGGGRQRVEAQHAKGKQTARERIAALVDPGTFHEIDAFITHRHTDLGLDENRVPGDSVVVGLATIAGRRVALAAQDFTVIGGSFSEAQAIKVGKILDLAMSSGVPFVALNDSVGARIQEGVWSLAGYSELFWRNTQASGVIPQISVMLGPCAGGSVYSPGLTDFVIMTENISHMFITGPEVIKTVTGEEVDFETLGGARAHAAISGVAHLVARDEADAMALTRRLLSYLPANNVEAPPPARPATPRASPAALRARAGPPPPSTEGRGPTTGPCVPDHHTLTIATAPTGRTPPAAEGREPTTGPCVSDHHTPTIATAPIRRRGVHGPSGTALGRIPPTRRGDDVSERGRPTTRTRFRGSDTRGVADPRIACGRRRVSPHGPRRYRGGVNLRRSPCTS